MHYWQDRIPFIRVLVFLLLCQFQPAAIAERDYPYWDTEAKLGKPFFHLEVYHRFAENPELERLDVVVDVIYDVLQFVREDSFFTASIELNLSLLKEKGELLSRKVKYFDAKVANYEKTNSRHDYLNGSFTLETSPGKYKIVMVLTDRESRRHTSIERSFTIEKTVVGQFGVSDLLLSKSTEIDPAKRMPIYPTAHGKIQDPSSTLYYYFDLFRQDPTQITNLTLIVYDKTENERYRDSLTIVGGEKLASYFIPLVCSGLNFGKYKVILKAKYSDKDVEKQTQFSVNYYGLPTSIQDINQAIEQLSIIADKKDIHEMIQLSSTEKEKAFIKFWDKIFPSPDETVNGKMIEYYQRANYAKEQFGNGRIGWKTDRGRIYIIYGKPSEVERHAFVDQEAPYEIWYYNHLKRRFIFKDEHGFGDYRLVTPVW